MDWSSFALEQDKRRCVKDRAEMVVCALFIVIGGLYWCGEVHKNDRKLERTSRCADTAVPDGTPIEWRAAWDACWEVTKP